MLLVANLANTKLCKKPEKLLKLWHMGTRMVFKNLLCPCVLDKVALALEGLNPCTHIHLPGHPAIKDPAGLEPGITCLRDRCFNHQATVNHFS